MLLAKDASSPGEISTLLQNLNLDPKTYQIGKTKVRHLSVLHQQAVQEQDKACKRVLTMKPLTRVWL